MLCRCIAEGITQPMPPYIFMYFSYALGNIYAPLMSSVDEMKGSLSQPKSQLAHFRQPVFAIASLRSINMVSAYRKTWFVGGAVVAAMANSY
eukprot:scaffold2142_cov18-Prasinocladus_malaysianus.AAC.1